MSEEIWVTKTGGRIAVGDMTESHAKNALRMLIRKFREEKERVEENWNGDNDFYRWDDSHPGHPSHYGDR